MLPLSEFMKDDTHSLLLAADLIAAVGLPKQQEKHEMKIIRRDFKKEAFKPIVIEITLETAKEAQVMYEELKEIADAADSEEGHWADKLAFEMSQGYRVII